MKNNLSDLGEELSDVMMGLAVAEEHSEIFYRLSEQRRELTEEFCPLFRHSHNVMR